MGTAGLCKISTWLSEQYWFQNWNPTIHFESFEENIHISTTELNPVGGQAQQTSTAYDFQSNFIETFTDFFPDYKDAASFSMAT